MKNFPSALIKQQSTKNGLGSNVSSTLKNIGGQVMSSILGGNNSKDFDREFARGYERPELDHLIDESNILEEKQDTQEIEKRINSTINLKYNTENGLPPKSADANVTFEDPFKFSSSIFSVINNYNYILASSAPSIYENMGDTESENGQLTKIKMSIVENAISPSLFNPYAGVNITGITENIPLIDREIDNINGEVTSGSASLSEKSSNTSIQLETSLWKTEKDLSDCSIKKLVELSQGNPPPLGLATYRYIDFMYCKDLGKIPNNRLITLRRFPVPIGDNIFQDAHPAKNHELLKSVPDIGRLITWFDNEDNKLENICRYNYHATWKEFTAEIQQKPSQERDDGIVSKLANFMSPQNNELIGKGFSGQTGLLSWGANMLHIPVLSGSNAGNQYYDLETLSNYDQNKIYTPIDRIWSTHKYEGKLEFNQEITLTFRYQLRGYSNINPRAALMDLIGNIHAVTYRRGSFWGGETKIYGPQGNSSVYEKANAFVDGTFEKLGGFWNNLINGEFDIEKLQGWLENVINKGGALFNSIQKTVSNVLNGETKEIQEAGKNLAQKTTEKLTETQRKTKFMSAIKGMIKNQLGRPAIYAFNSLLTGEEVGPWHLTIGNPRNPIMSIGNLILENSEIIHYGPLGIDDFPTELSVTVTLKHAMPRDSVGIQRMYTKGEGSIYKPMNLMDVDKYWKNDFAFGDVITDDKVLKKNLSAL